MRVLHVHNEITSKGGTEVYLSDLQELLPTYGHDSFWLAIQGNNDWRWILHGYEWIEVPDKKTLKEQLTEWIDKNEIQIVCIHNLFDSELVDFFISLLPVIKFSHSPVIVCPGRDKFWRGSNKPCTEPYGLHCFWHAYTEKCTNRHPKRLLSAWNFVRDEIVRAKTQYRKTIVMSEYNNDLLRECGVPESQVFVNPYFTKYKVEIPESDIIEERIYMLFIGRIVAGKGLIEMLNAVEGILKHSENIHLDIIGDGIMMEEVKSVVASKMLENYVTFWGWLPHQEIDRLMERSYLVIFPSTYPESFGIVGIEAMMAAKPVVGFDAGGVSTWLKDKENGFLIPSANIELMRNAINNLIDNKNLWRSMSRKGREIALTSFLPHVHLEKLISLFKETIDGSMQSFKIRPVSAE
jgi:glycosyltransferase involved in cell wall biosynthesis